MEQKKNSARPLTEYLYAKASWLRIPLSGTFELSPVCNFACRMCYVRKTREEVACNPRNMMTLDHWRAIARDAREAGLLELLLTGGEPLLWPDFWTLYEELVDMGFLVSINTNGSLIDEAAIRRFRERPPQKVNITLYGASDNTYRRLCGIGGVFSKVDGAIRGLMDAGIQVKLNCSLTPENAQDLDWIVDYAAKRNTVLSVATYMYPPVRRAPEQIGVNERFTPEDSAEYLMRYLRRSRGEALYQRYLRSILAGSAEPLGLESGCIDPVDGRVRCRAGRASFWVTWDGWMTACGMMPQPQIDLNQFAFPEAWAQLTEQTASLTLSGLCEKCANREICHPCAAMAWAETGSYSGVPTYKCHETRKMCEIAKENVRDSLPEECRGGMEE
jgi:MoaA/NifB/PqqE/SkfB family radical SAM enzyme